MQPHQTLTCFSQKSQSAKGREYSRKIDKIACSAHWRKVTIEILWKKIVRPVKSAKHGKEKKVKISLPEKTFKEAITTKRIKEISGN